MSKQREDLPDGWIRTPLPPMPREDAPEHSWFARTGEPAPPRRPPAAAPPPRSLLAIGVLVLGFVFALSVAVGAVYLWAL